MKHIAEFCLWMVLGGATAVWASGVYGDTLLTYAACGTSATGYPAHALCWDGSGWEWWDGAAWNVQAALNWWSGGSGALSTSAATNFFPAMGVAAISATEGPVGLPLGKAAAISSLWCHTTATEGAAKSDAFTLRVNGASPASGLTCTMTNARTCSDTAAAHKVTIAANDVIDIQDVTVGSSITARSGGCSIGFL